MLPVAPQDVLAVEADQLVVTVVAEQLVVVLGAGALVVAAVEHLPQDPGDLRPALVRDVPVSPPPARLAPVALTALLARLARLAAVVPRPGRARPPGLSRRTVAAEQAGEAADDGDIGASLTVRAPPEDPDLVESSSSGPAATARDTPDSGACRRASASSRRRRSSMSPRTCTHARRDPVVVVAVDGERGAGVALEPSDARRCAALGLVVDRADERVADARERDRLHARLARLRRAARDGPPGCPRAARRPRRGDRQSVSTSSTRLAQTQLPRPAPPAHRRAASRSCSALEAW